MRNSENLPNKLVISENLVNYIDRDIKSLNEYSSSNISLIRETLNNTRHIRHNEEDNTIVLDNRAIRDLVAQIEKVTDDHQSQSIKKSIFQKLSGNQNKAGYNLGRK